MRRQKKRLIVGGNYFRPPLTTPPITVSLHLVWGFFFKYIFINSENTEKECPKIDKWENSCTDTGHNNSCSQGRSMYRRESPLFFFFSLLNFREFCWLVVPSFFFFRFLFCFFLFFFQRVRWQSRGTAGQWTSINWVKLEKESGEKKEHRHTHTHTRRLGTSDGTRPPCSQHALRCISYLFYLYLYIYFFFAREHTDCCADCV